MEESGRSGVEPPTEVDVRPLGPLSVGFGALALVLALTYFYGFLAYPAAALALVLGLLARSDAGTRRSGTVAIVLAGLAVVAATVVLAVGWG